MPSATVIQLKRPARLRCSCCGATADAACNCGATYVPASIVAAEAVAKAPNKSDRAIAAEIGVSHKTVGKARKSTGELYPVEKRTGKDGKARRLPTKQPPLPSDPIQAACDDCDTPEQFWQRSVSNMAGDAVSMQAFWSREFGAWQKFDAPSSLVTLVKQAAAAWTQLAADLSKTRRQK